MSDSDSDDDVPLAQRSLNVEAPQMPKQEVKPEPASAAAEAPKRKAEAAPSSPKKQKAPVVKPEVKPEVKSAPKKAAPTTNGAEKRKAAENGSSAKKGE
eukprot:CAMPEP_0119092564 /NCGR_PEP_ID=MMETSP1178-20130426/160190_1 /TAXON_ID=33656 /ORGANISM="unid sp, Strain CCMP2000" /LENGTH=98 /DNA_ID=CAMNT_0007076153 /DNA_START=21 /DNA_END=314 /DNA_ORIENTATION=-